MSDDEKQKNTQKSRNLIAGFLCAGVLAAEIVILFWGLGESSRPATPGIFINMPYYLALNVSGPGVGIVLWANFRNSRKHFARGALVLGVVWFAVIGACWVAMSNNFI